MTEAEKSYKRWHRWAACVRRRWLPDSPMYQLAERMLREAEQRKSSRPERDVFVAPLRKSTKSE